MSSKADRVFPSFGPARQWQKSRWNPAASPNLDRAWARGSEPPGAVPSVPVHAGAAIAVHAALHPAMPPAAFAPEPAAAMGQEGEAALLAVVERLVERVGRVGDLLQRRSRSRH